MGLRPRLGELCVRSLFVMGCSYARGGDSPWLHQGQWVALRSTLYIAIIVKLRLKAGFGCIFATCVGIRLADSLSNGVGD